MSQHDYGVSTRTLTVLCYVITLVWATNIVAPLVVDGYAGNTGVNGVMGALLGVLGAARYQASRNKERPRKKADNGE
ncbi:hypothetical protein BJY24_004136 [Nocardia transvalensis]|uniref:Uncharacterized protein n=1 Tax=Nocardia transvalensis TaxID=37333 RepID=A0A7W9PGP7_9NOCA|nr:hypothetical protein [Nocardia transvalensis]MBB5915269.1 hypothetical protein [Nocardia transvalensis]